MQACRRIPYRRAVRKGKSRFRLGIGCWPRCDWFPLAVWLSGSTTDTGIFDVRRSDIDVPASVDVSACQMGILACDWFRNSCHPVFCVHQKKKERVSDCGREEGGKEDVRSTVYVSNKMLTSRTYCPTKFPVREHTMISLYAHHHRQGRRFEMKS